jgi:LDH2 family malate/lactate/ureidoglycolate dehydrogenase
MSDSRYDAETMKAFAAQLLIKTGMDDDKAAVVAEVLLEGDLMGHTTHGYQLLAPYLGALEAGTMTGTGQPETLKDTGPAILWDGRSLPGTWLVDQGLELAVERARKYGLAAISIRKSHHIATLAAYLKKVTDQGMMVLVYTSDPAVASVAPFGGLRGVYTPDPIGIGIPTTGDPILIDISMSITTNGMTDRLHKEGGKFPHPWIQDNKGNASDDPKDYYTDPLGTILPIGGKDHGHKGFSLGLYVEAMTSGLNGYGRKDGPTTWGGAIFLQVYDPEAFGGRAEFEAESAWMVDACVTNPVPEGAPPVRIPGASGLNKRADNLANGIVFHPGILDALKPWAEKTGIAMPEPK